MKINKDLRISTEGTRQEIKSGSSEIRFQELVLRQNEKLQTNQLNALLKNIDDIGTRLSKSQNLKDLTKYKSLVKQFMKETVDYGLELKQNKSWDQLGQGRDLNTIKVIDEKLIQLTEEVRKKESRGLAILDTIGEIKGLLINIYM